MHIAIDPKCTEGPRLDLLPPCSMDVGGSEAKLHYHDLASQLRSQAINELYDKLKITPMLARRCVASNDGLANS